MSNIENIKKAIQVMERVKKNEEELGRQLFDLRLFQGNHINPKGKVLKTEEEALDDYGTVCCFAGWLAVSPEFNEMGYCFGQHYAPGIEGKRNETEALGDILGLDKNVIDGLIYNIGTKFGLGEDYYGKPSKDVIVDDVIEKLKSFIGEE